MNLNQFPDKIFAKIQNKSISFSNELIIELFNYQYLNCSIYKKYVDAIGVEPQKVSQILQIPFLPISFFKSHQVVSCQEPFDINFKSSGTTSETTAMHYVKNVDLYRNNFNLGFEKFYNHIQDKCIIGLLPSYVENGKSSLVYMVDDLITKSQHPLSGIYLYDFKKLIQTLLTLKKTNTPTILIGVTYALLQFAEQFPMSLYSNCIIMETGGMKGRGNEMTRTEVHTNLKNAFQLELVHSEYGMTELLSQAYSLGNGIFECSPTLKVLIRDFNDPFETNISGKGAMNFIDLANIYSCSFIATQDVGEVLQDGRFLINGRMDLSDVRGCNMLV